MSDNRPHSRACGPRVHAHGTQCHVNCPTCHGNEAFEGPYEHRVIFDPSAPTLVVSDATLVNRLRHLSSVVRSTEACQAMAEAADEIDRLNARIKELEKPPTRAITSSTTATATT